MSWDYARPSQQAASPRRALTYGIARVLLILEGIFALGVWLFSYNSPSLANRLVGENLGPQITHESTFWLIVGGLIAIAATGLLVRLSRGIFGQLLIVVVYGANIYFAFFSDLKLATTPVFFETTFVGGLIVLFLLLTLFMRDTSRSEE